MSASERHHGHQRLKKRLVGRTEQSSSHEMEIAKSVAAADHIHARSIVGKSSARGPSGSTELW